MSCFKHCFRKHYYRYELGITKINEARALRMGSAIHDGLEYFCRRKPVEDAITVIRDTYSATPDWAMEHLDEWFTECAAIVALVTGYYWLYSNDDLEILDTEKSFRLPLINPDGRASQLFDHGGKRDARARLPDGRIAIVEHKTCGEDIAPGSDYWTRLRIDQQISGYWVAAEAMGETPDTVLYDVIRKPTIKRLLATPPDKLKRTKNGKLYANQREVDMTPDEFGLRLLSDIYERPDFYYQRQEIPRLVADIESFRHELWQTQKMIRHCQLNEYWFKNVSAWTCPFCEFKDLCYQSVYPIGDATPAGFVRLENVHPELDFDKPKGDSNASSPPETAPEAATAEAADCCDVPSCAVCGGGHEWCDKDL
jgi:hypothetical protein